MADLVQQNMEDMIPELNAFKTLKIFDSDEIKHIIKIRKDYEFQIINNDIIISKKGYRNYINFEKQLDSIVKLRIKSLKISNVTLPKVKRRQWKRGRLINTTLIQPDPSRIARIAISRRIHFLYKRAINRFKEDNKLRIEYVIYCMKHGSHKKAEDGLWNILSKRPNDINLWFYTASITMNKRGIKPAINVLTRSIRNIHNLKLYKALINLQIERAYQDFKSGQSEIDISNWHIITKYAIKRLPTNQATSFLLSLFDKMCKVIISGKFRESLSNFDDFIIKINDLLHKQSKVDSILIAYLWKIQITELMVNVTQFKRKNTFSELFKNIISDCKNDGFKIYLLSAMLFYTFNEGDFYTIDGDFHTIDGSNPNYNLFTYTLDEMANLFPNKTELLSYYPEFLIIANLSPYISQSTCINTCNILIKLKEFIATSLGGINWARMLEQIIENLISENLINSRELELDKSICISAVFQVLKSCGKNLNLMDKVKRISSGPLTLTLLIEETGIENFIKFIKSNSFKITRFEESRILIQKMLSLTNHKYILYELFNHFSEDLLSCGIEFALENVDIKEIPSNLKGVVKLKLCEAIIKKNIKNEMNLINSAHLKRLEAMEELSIDKNDEINAWLDYINFSKNIQDKLIHTYNIPTPGVIYNKAIARLGSDFIN